MVVFLAIRGLGKVKHFSKVRPKDSRSPEQVMLHIMHRVPNMVPSVGKLSLEMQRLLEKTLETHSRFNLAQMLQGENTPAQVHVLIKFIRTLDEENEEVQG